MEQIPSWEADISSASWQILRVLYCAVLRCAVLHCTVLHCTVLYCTVLHCTALHCTALHCTALNAYQRDIGVCLRKLKHCTFLKVTDNCRPTYSSVPWRFFEALPVCQTHWVTRQKSQKYGMVDNFVFLLQFHVGWLVIMCFCFNSICDGW